MDIKTEKQIHMTQTKDVTSFSWVSNTELLFTSKRNKPKAGTTDFYTISIEGGEAKKHSLSQKLVVYLYHLEINCGY